MMPFRTVIILIRLDTLIPKSQTSTLLPVLTRKSFSRIAT
jgi:hypothetical protein